MITAPHPELQALSSEEPALADALATVPLGCPTREIWVRAALAEPLTLLDDHAQCELKAASNALALVGRHPEFDALVHAMGALAREEMQHYRMVREVLLARGGRPTRPVANPYLKGVGRDRRGGDAALLEELVVCALVEARSCERFVQLARAFAGIGEPELADFYARLARSESGHARLFVGLAEEVHPAARVAEEIARRSGFETATLESLPVTPRMHGGHRAV